MKKFIIAVLLILVPALASGGWNDDLDIGGIFTLDGTVYEADGPIAIGKTNPHVSISNNGVSVFTAAGNSVFSVSSDGSTYIGTVGGAATLTLNGTAITGGGSGTVTGTGVSPYPLTGASVFTMATMDGRTKIAPFQGATPSAIVELPTITSIANTGVFFMDGKPDAGLTVFCTGNSVWYGSGAQSGTGSTVWVDAGSGNSNFSTGVIGAVRNGVLVWKVIPCDLTWKYKP